jgi:hypothetical protein
VESFHDISYATLRRLLSDQPTSAAKVAFAWRMAAGAPLARATRVEWTDATLRVHVGDAHWQREVRRARPMLVERMSQLLGSGVVTTLVVVAPQNISGPSGRRSRHA